MLEREEISQSAGEEVLLLLLLLLLEFGILLLLLLLLLTLRIDALETHLAQEMTAGEKCRVDWVFVANLSQQTKGKK